MTRTPAATAEPGRWTEHGRPVSGTFAKVTLTPGLVLDGAQTVTVGQAAGWQDAELHRLLTAGWIVRNAVAERWANGYLVRSSDGSPASGPDPDGRVCRLCPAHERVCRFCWRPVYDTTPGLGRETWNLVYREYEQTAECDARSDFATLSRLPHLPWQAERPAPLYGRDVQPGDQIRVDTRWYTVLHYAGVTVGDDRRWTCWHAVSSPALRRQLLVELDSAYPVRSTP